MNRRRFIRLGGLSLTGGIVACNSQGPASAQRILRFAESKNEAVERGIIFRHNAMDHAHPNAKLAGAAFPKYHISPTVPVWDEKSRGVWRLEITGAVRRPLQLTLEDLMKFPGVSQKVNHYCVEGWTAVAVWSGVRMSDLARAAGITPDAQYADFLSFDDDYHESWDIDSVLHPQTLIAYGMDGRLLSPDHGAPARLHSPVKLGYKNTKYLTQIVFTPHKTGGYWSDQGYEWYGGV
jgi:DMSO/TMAO reductase YedYZ molybdopterin-dependent catalytic subunit